MFFLLRTAFWLCVVLALLPSGGGSAPQKQASVGTFDAVAAAGAAVSDMAQFCERQPDACDIGAQAAVAFGQRAQAGALMVYEFLNERMTPTQTGSIGAPASPQPLPGRSQHTLRPTDMQPAWRGPLPRPDPREGKRPA